MYFTGRTLSLATVVRFKKNLVIKYQIELKRIMDDILMDGS
jgi:hypothetical protein